MEQNILKYNKPTFTFRKCIMVTSVVCAAIALFTGISAIVTHKLSDSSSTSSAYVQPQHYSLLAVSTSSTNGKATGKAIVNLDGFRIETSFRFNDADITELSVNKITDATGHQYLDFTNRDDIEQIIALIKPYLQHNVEGV